MHEMHTVNETFHILLKELTVTSCARNKRSSKESHIADGCTSRHAFIPISHTFFF